MKQDAGYTLVEMLAALAVISLTFAGLGQGVHAIGARQKAAGTHLDRSNAYAVAQEELQAILTGLKPGDISGDARSLRARCLSASRCEFWPQGRDDIVRTQRSGTEIVLTAGADYAFSYQTTSGAKARWPDDQGVLVGIALHRKMGGGFPTAYMRVREQQDFHCIYDVVIASCREAAP